MILFKQANRPGGNSERGENMKSEKQALSVADAAARLGICRSLCYRLVREGTIPSVQLGRRVLIPVTALEEMLSVKQTQEECYVEKKTSG